MQGSSNSFKNFLDKIPTGVLSGLTLAVILWLTLAPHPTGNIKLPLFPGFDKIVHGLMFGFLAFVMLLEWMKRRRWQTVPMAGVAVVAFAVSGIGIAIEFIQRAMGLGRTLEIYDMLADASGAMIAAGVFGAFQSYFTNHDP